MDIINRNSVEDAMNNGYNFDIGRYVSEGIEIIKKDIGLFIGYAVVYFLIIVVANFIPFIGSIATTLIGAPLAAGFFIGAHKAHRNEGIEFGDFFKGFDYFAQLLVQSIIVGLVMLVLMIPLFVMFGTAIFAVQSGTIPDITLGFAGILGVIVLVIGAIFISISYIFAPHLIVFGNMQAWDAMETSRKIAMKNFFPIFALTLILGLINLVGALPCGLGLLFTVPASAAIIYAAFKDVVDLDNPDNDDHNQGDAFNHLVD